MRKSIFTVVSIAVFSLMTSAAHAWDICIQDQQYVTQLQISFDAPFGSEYLVRGQAIASGTSFPAPIAGSLNVNTLVLSMTIGYKEVDTSRHYLWFLGAPGYPAYTWGILPADSSYYDGPRIAEIVGCTPSAIMGQEGELPEQVGNAISSLPPAAEAGQEGATGAL